MNNPSTMPREDVLRVKLELLQREHRDLDDAIAALDAVRQHEAALELPCRDPAMQEDPAVGFVVLPSADHQLVVLQGDREVVLGEAGDGEGDPVRGFAALLDIVGRIAVIAGLGAALDQPVELLEAEQVGMGGESDLCHVRASP